MQMINLESASAARREDVVIEGLPIVGRTAFLALTGQIIQFIDSDKMNWYPAPAKTITGHKPNSLITLHAV